MWLVAGHGPGPRVLSTRLLHNMAAGFPHWKQSNKCEKECPSQKLQPFKNSVLDMTSHHFCCILLFIFIYLFILSFLGLYLQHTEVPRLGVNLELQLPTSTTATAMPDPSHICDLHHSFWQPWILNPLSEARDWTYILMDGYLVGFVTAEPQRELPVFCFLQGSPQIQLTLKGRGRPKGKNSRSQESLGTIREAAYHTTHLHDWVGGSVLMKIRNAVERVDFRGLMKSSVSDRNYCLFKWICAAALGLDM